LQSPAVYPKNSRKENLLKTIGGLRIPPNKKSQMKKTSWPRSRLNKDRPGEASNPLQLWGVDNPRSLAPIPDDKGFLVNKTSQRRKIS